MEFLGPFMSRVISSANKTLTSLSICIPLISFSCLITLAKMSNTILTRYAKSGQFCHVPDFSANASA